MASGAQTFRYFWIFVFDQAGRAALDAATLKSGAIPGVQGTQGAAVVTMHFEELALASGAAANMDIAVEGVNLPDGKYDIRTVPMQGDRNAAQKWLTEPTGASYKANAIAYRLAHVAVS